MRVLVCFAIAMAVPAAAQQRDPQPIPASAAVNSKAIELFERDWVLMDWGLRTFDRDGDARLSADEATAGAIAFKKIADSDTDGKVTPSEFRRAREFLLARY